MKILFYSAKDFEIPYLKIARKEQFEIILEEKPLNITTVMLAKNIEVISIFTGDDASEPILRNLKRMGVKLIAIRAAGYDNVDLEMAAELGIQVVNVPAYSPYAVAEHAIALILALNRKITTANEQVHRNNFKVNNLIGFDLNKKTVGIIGTGKIGSVLAKILYGLGCRILAYDIKINREIENNFQVHYVTLDELCRQSDIISIHTPLTKDTLHLIDKKLMEKMKTGVMLINTSRGSVLNTEDLIANIESGKIGYAGLDVYEKEKGVFFYDLSDKPLRDPILSKLLSLPNVLITPHQGFATSEALQNIAITTFRNIDMWQKNTVSGNELINKHELIKSLN